MRLEGFIETDSGTRKIFIPRHVMEMDKFDRRWWMKDRGITPAIGGGTSFNGSETLASMTIAGGVTGPTNGEASVLTRECLEPVAPSYFARAGNRFQVMAHGTILGTTTITTQQLTLEVGPTYASPVAGQMIAKLPTALTPGTTAVVTDWFLNILVTVRATGSSGSLLAMGFLVNNMVTNATWQNSIMKSTAINTAAAPVVMTGGGGLLVPIYFDLTSNQAAATAGNSCTCLDYTLISLN